MAQHDPAGVYDIVGIGFGPSNLSLAIAVTELGERSDGPAVTAQFIEQQPVFGWHRGMLLDDATMQVSFLKDLVTLRNPASRFSFLSYLHDRGRLVDFINHKSLFPLRLEFHDYLEWAAAQVSDMVAFGQRAVRIEPVVEDGVVTCFDVITQPSSHDSSHDSGRDELDGQQIIRTRNIVLGTGLTPYLPDGRTTSPRVWHSHQLLTRVPELDGSAPSRFVVVGAGQSAAEITAFLHERFAEAEVCSVFSRYGYSPADDSPFANRIFDPDAVDDFFDASPAVKAMLIDYHGNTNYSVVDNDLITDLYQRSYQEKVTGRERLRMLNVSRVLDVTERPDRVDVTIETLTTGETSTVSADLIVYATGYTPVDPYPLLGEIGSFCPSDAEGRVRVQRDYRVVTTPEITAGVYLQGGTEHTHGISSSLLSNTAVRAGEILGSIVETGSVRTDLGSALSTELRGAAGIDGAADLATTCTH